MSSGFPPSEAWLDEHEKKALTQAIESAIDTCVSVQQDWRNKVPGATFEAASSFAEMHIYLSRAAKKLGLSVS